MFHLFTKIAKSNLKNGNRKKKIIIIIKAKYPTNIFDSVALV